MELPRGIFAILLAISVPVVRVLAEAPLTTIAKRGPMHMEPAVVAG
jgi:hypothetical protein